MEKLSEQLQNIKFDRIVIVDDTPADIDAAKKAAENLPGIKFIFCQSAAEVLSLILEDADSIDLIITDLDMEESQSGLEVVETGFNNNIFVVVASGGFQHRDMSQVRLASGIESQVEGDKSESDTWVSIFNAIVETSTKQSILKTYLLTQKAGVNFKNSKQSSFPIGEHVKMVVGSFFEDV